MNNLEAAALLQEHLNGYRQRPWSELVASRGRPQIVELQGASGCRYTIEVVVHWDDEPGGAVRVLGSIDDRWWRSFMPVSQDIILAPDGRFVGE